ncbi:AAA family ATPase [Pantoea ananatis]|uniref:AAA family ATPase n=1 Tax=Pantoea ananas TaxID=553 RepID=UPI001377ECC9|nr:AAA family ATPase [Pantoea ananatis]MDF7791692.1 AAA family ATPase [Pantoea ananatis]
MKNITIILGENGKGKTRSLLKIFESEKNKSSIAVISNSLINKFPKIEHKRITQYLISSTHSQTNDYESFLYGEFNKIITPFNIGRALDILEYLGFERYIRIILKPNYRIIKINNEIVMRKISTENSIGGAYNQKPITRTVSSEYSDYIQKEHYFEIKNKNTSGINDYSKHLIRNEVINAKTNIDDEIFSTSFFLKKKNMEFPLSQASSGELYMLGIGLFIIKFISGTDRDIGKKILLIDEPENSLHPKWQREYIQNILDFIGNKKVDIYIATHSPFIAIPSNIEDATINVASVEEGNLEYKKFDAGSNIEEIYYDYFGILTPKNRYLSEYCQSLLKKFTTGDTTFLQAGYLLEEMKKASNDPRQIEFIESIKDLLLQLNEKRL